MGLREARTSPARAETADAERVAWHDLECGSYRADMALWGELASAASGAGGDGWILDIGAGTGRVSRELARAGHAVCALDRDPALLRALERRALETRLAGGNAAALETVCADARGFELERRDFALCLVPMQTIQLLGGSEERAAFLRSARAHLRPGAPLACAIVTDVEPFDCAAGDAGPSAESARVDGALFVSRAVRVSMRRRSIRIERERRIARPGRAPAAAVGEPERDVIELDRLSAARLQREGRRAGLLPRGVHAIAATEEHVGSEVVIFSA